MSNKPTVTEIFIIIRRGLMESLDKIASQFKGNDFPSDKMILHSVVSVGYSCAQLIDYPFERILAAHLTVLVKNRAEGLRMLNEFYDRADGLDDASKKDSKLLS